MASVIRDPHPSPPILKEVVALDLAKSTALGTFPTDAERALDLYDQDPPIWCRDRPPVMDERKRPANRIYQN